MGMTREEWAEVDAGVGGTTGGLKRNVAVALGNWLVRGDEPREEVAALADSEPLVRVGTRRGRWVARPRSSLAIRRFRAVFFLLTITVDRGPAGVPARSPWRPAHGQGTSTPRSWTGCTPTTPAGRWGHPASAVHQGLRVHRRLPGRGPQAAPERGPDRRLRGPHRDRLLMWRNCSPSAWRRAAASGNISSASTTP
jgi:hypothetical protein